MVGYHPGQTIASNSLQRREHGGRDDGANERSKNDLGRGVVADGA
jgi:hypothetical protein